MKNRKLTALKKRILAAALCAAMLAGTLATDGLLSYHDRSNVSADELDADHDDTDMEETDENMETDINDDVEIQDDDVSDEDEDLSDTEQTEEDSLTDGEPDDDLSGTEQTDEDDLDNEESDNEEPKEVVLTCEADGVYVTVEGMSDALNGAVEVRISDVTDEKAADYEAYFSELASEEDDYDTVYLVPHVFDISLFDEDGEEVEPSDGVNVSLYGTMVEEVLAKTGYELSIYHDELSSADFSSSMFSMAGYNVSDDDSADTDDMPDFYLEHVEFKETDGVLKFTTGGFSDYALVLTGNNTQKEFDFNDGTYFELDKYLEASGEANGQTSYNVYLEHAFYDDSRISVNSYAPARTDFMFCLDQSASVSGYTAEYNEAVSALLHKIADTNAEREQNALDGKYDDIDPDFVAQSDANMVSAMRDHYMYVAGVVGYNNHLYERWDRVSNPTLIRTSAEADTIAAAAYIKPDYGDYCNGATGTDQQDFTRTDLGTKWMYDKAKQGNWSYTYKTKEGTYNWNSLCCVLITDGDPYGEETTPTWPYPDSNFSGNAFSIYAANRALYYANKLKQECGSMNFGIYVPFRNGNDASVLKAVETGDINDLVIKPGKDIITLAFLSLWSSDIPNNGLFETVGNDNYHGNTTGNFYYYQSSKPRTFGKYIYADRSYPDLVNYVDSIVARINTEAWSSVNSRGYFGADTIMQDEITDPFEVISRDSIQVYAVPRIPVNLNSNGVPTDMDEDTYEVSEFRWGEMSVEDEDGEVSTEWVDITEDVIITLNGGRVTVSGYDFEWNSVTDYDKDMVRYGENDSCGNGLVYKPGDYGYKVMVIIPIQAKFSFGGNSIKTNNSDVSGVIPSDPIGNNPNPPWQENDRLNPDGDKFLEMYPTPEVDLNISYKITKDDAVIYAPQTKELHDLLTDTMNSIWYVDDGYSSLKTIRDNVKFDLEMKEETYYDLLTNASDPMDIVKAQQEVIEATDALYLAQKNLDSVLCYIPDGRNNAFVDIFYSFQDPDGNRIATMSVPHGQAYDADSPNIDWNMATDGMVLNEDGNPIITKSGIYTITATVTPVDTTRSPDWHVYTDTDDDTQGTLHPYHSTDYSATGSTAGGSQSEITVQENPEAYLFTLELTADDSRREPGQAIDFFEGSSEMRDMIDRAVNKHIKSYKWVCTDGVTESKAEDEPGIDKKMATGSDVMLEVNVPGAAFTDGLVENVESVTTIRAETGQYVPVGVVTWRTTGCLNKSAGVDEQVRQRDVVMTDTDNVYGPGISSVSWVHECKVFTDHDCTQQEFAESHMYDEAEERGSAGVVRFLMHVYENPQPDIEKSTTTPVITAGSEILWDIQLENTDYDKNNHMLPSEFSMVDVLPWKGDKRVDPNYGADRKDGSDFGGSLYYTKMSVDHSNLASGSDGLTVYYTNDTNVRTATEQQLLGKVDGITWSQAEAYAVSDTVTGFNIPDTATAIRLDTTLMWEETLGVSLGANVKNLADQETGDYYCNEAWILQDRGEVISSDVVTTEVVSLHIAGTIWEDSDLDGLMMADEPKVSGIRVTIYQPYNSKNPNRVVRTIEGLQLSEVFDLDNNKFVPINTGTNGSYMFDNIPSGTYYIVADLIPEDFDVTKKKAGEGNGNDARIDSEAETNFIASGEALEKTLWIKAITINNSSADNQNIGLTRIKGNIDVGKVVNEILYPSAMTEEERADYRINATFVLKNQDTGIEYKRTVYLKEDTIALKNGRPQVWAHFEDLPLGTYELTEVFDPNYHLSGVKYTKGSVAFDRASGVTTVKITADSTEVQLWMENVARPDPPAGDENGVTNFVNIRTPIKLEVVYSGPDPISDHSIYEYVFKASDFDHSKKATDGSDRYGDIIVTYDDGSQIKLSDGTLSFDALTFNPTSVDSSMNSDRRRTNISVFYVERGHMVRDSFNVRVDLKPYFRFNVLFNANGSSFDTSAATNNVDFMYNEMLGYNEITTGVYKDTKNGGLNVLDGFWQAGWNTSPDGQGTQYGGADDALTPLNKIGQDKKLNSLQLYANWKTTVTFNANGGTINGKGSQNVTYSKGQSIGSPGTPVKTNYKFVLWNTKADGTGEELSEYNRNHNGCQGPITFYAIYYQSDYAFTGTVQTFTAPVSGIYEFELWGSPGGAPAGNATSKGGYTKFYMHLDNTVNLYCFVGGAGNPAGGNVTIGGWNGGGAVSTCYIGAHAGSGGGMTHVSYTNNLATTYWNPYGTIGVAGGGGGSSSGGRLGGAGGGISAGSGSGYQMNSNNKHLPYGATQTSGYRQGVGEPCANSGGGGGGWYGGWSTGQTRQTNGGNCRSGGGGGSGYICPAGQQTKYTYLNKCLSGNDASVPAKPNSGTPLGLHGYIRITLYERD